MKNQNRYFENVFNALDVPSYCIDMQLDCAANILQKYIQGIERHCIESFYARERRDTSRLLSWTDSGGDQSRAKQCITRLQYYWSIVSGRPKGRCLTIRSCQNRFLVSYMSSHYFFFLILYNFDLYRCISFSEPFEATEVLRNLSITLHPQMVSFQEITRLMQQCELLDRLQVKATSALPTNALSRAASSITLFSGILPGQFSLHHFYERNFVLYIEFVSKDYICVLLIKKYITIGTKWCGTGDIAENYHDLGDLPYIDR